ncbi:Apoptosis-inducing factor 2 [Aphanomyces cochlioides]|nr:Apoptosis-inducing factor 2 [Aphanomyces cochlioides]
MKVRAVFMRSDQETYDHAYGCNTQLGSWVPPRECDQSNLYDMANIVVVGGGYIGIQFAQELAKQLPAKLATITVVEKNDFTFHCVGMPRALVNPSFIEHLFIPLKHALPYPHAKIVRGIVEEIQDNHVVIRRIVSDQAEGTTTNIPFDYLVLATGSSYASPIKVANDQYTCSSVEKALVDTANSIRAASSVLVVGGGPVGVEIAAEIAYAYPSKRVTILEGNTRLVYNSVLLGERLPGGLPAHSFSTTTLVTDKGTEIESDVQLLCAGATANGDLIRRLDPSLVTLKQAIRVTPGCKLDDPRFPNVYVVGDANDHPTPKLSYLGHIQAVHVAKELAKVIRNSGRGDVAPFVHPSTDVMMIPLGPRRGVSQLPLFHGLIVGDLITSMVKSKDYFTAKYFKAWRINVDGEEVP